MSLLTALTLEGPDGLDVPLLQLPRRRVSKADGLAGVRVRTVSSPAVGRRGTRNRTRFRDESEITLTGMLTADSDDQVWDEYTDLARAAAGAVSTDRLLKWTLGTGRQLQQQVRLTELTPAFEVGRSTLAYQLSLSGSDPNAYSQTEFEASAQPLSAGAGGGLEFPLVWPLLFNGLLTSTIAIDLSDGIVPSPPILELDGYLKNPRIRLNDDPDLEIVLAGEIANGDQVVIDLTGPEPTVTLNAIANRLSLVVFEETTWFTLPPQLNQLMLLAEAFDDGQLTVRARPAYE